MAAETYRLTVDWSVEDNTSEGISSASENVTHFDQILRGVQERLDETSDTAAGFGEALSRTEQRLVSASTSAGQYADTLAETEQQISATNDRADSYSDTLADVEYQQRQAADSATDFGESGVAAFDEISNAISAAGIMIGLKKIADGFVECVDAASGLQEAMSNVEALSGASSAELEALTSKARELGATTKFTAMESAEAMGYMAMAGWSAGQMLDGISGVMNLAAASGENLAQVSDIVTDALTAFGLKASDSAHFSDVLAKTAASANTNVSLMGASFKYAAPLAGTLGYSIEDVALAVGLMANAGIKGEQAGTALRSVFTRLANPPKEAADAIEELGIHVADAAGNMLPLSDVMNQLRDSFSTLSDEQKAQMAASLAGQEAMSGFLAIIDASESDYTSLADKISDCSGAAEKMAKVKMDNLSGDLTLLESSVDGLKTSIGNAFLPELRGLVSVGTDITSGINDFVAKHPATVKSIAGFTGAIGLATAGVMAFSTASKIASAIGLPGILASAGPFLAVAAAVAGLTAVFIAAEEEWRETTKAAVELDEATSSLNKTLASTSIQSIESEAAANAAAAQAYMDKIEQLGAIEQRTEQEELRYQAAMAGLLQIAPEFTNFIDRTEDAYGRVTYAVKGTNDEMRAQIELMRQQAVMSALQDRMDTVLAAEAEVMFRIENAKIDRSSALEVKEELEAQKKAIQDQMKNFVVETDADYDTMTAWDTELLYLENSISSVDAEIEAYDRSIASANKELEAAQAETAKVAEIQNTLAEEMANAAAQAGNGESAMQNYKTSLEDMQSIMMNFTDEASKLAKAYTDAFEAAQKSVEGQYALWDSADKIVPTSIDKITKSLESQQSHWQTYSSDLASLRERTGDIEGLQEMLASFADGSASSVNAVAGMASASDDELRKMVNSWKDVQAEQQSAEEMLAEMSSNMQKGMDELVEKMTSDIEGMDLSSEAWSAGMETIQGFIDAANDPTIHRKVRSAYGSLASAATDAMNAAAPGGGNGGNEGSGAGEHAEGGIMNAPHLALIAEDGPEAIIPLGSSSRARGISLWEQAGSILGVDSQAPKTGTNDDGTMELPSVWAQGAQTAPTGDESDDGIPASIPMKTSPGNPTAAAGAPVNIPVNLVLNMDTHIHGSDGMTPEDVAEVLKGRIRELVDDISDEMAEQLAKVFANMPVASCA